MMVAGRLFVGQAQVVSDEAPAETKKAHRIGGPL